MFNQLDTLSQQLGTGEAAQTYSGLGLAGRGGTGAERAALGHQRLQQHRHDRGHDAEYRSVRARSDRRHRQLGVSNRSEQQGAFSLDNTGQTTTQERRASDLDQIVSLLNTQVGDNYLFSGSAVNQPSVASADDILNGNGAQAGLTQIIADRAQADRRWRARPSEYSGSRIWIIHGFDQSGRG